eukprot:m.18251 g.18251  ORF g.18251 m.18251 type:complete len:52 (-) comp4934_c0_seq1:249-404(-)
MVGWSGVEWDNEMSFMIVFVQYMHVYTCVYLDFPPFFTVDDYDLFFLLRSS